MIIGGLAIWVGVPVVNSVFDLAVMASAQTVPVAGISGPLSTILGGSMLVIGIMAYLGHRTGWW